MRPIVIVLAYLVCAGHARKLQPTIKREQHRHSQERISHKNESPAMQRRSRNILEGLMSLLLAFCPFVNLHSGAALDPRSQHIRLSRARRLNGRGDDLSSSPASVAILGGARAHAPLLTDESTSSAAPAQPPSDNLISKIRCALSNQIQRIRRRPLINKIRRASWNLIQRIRYRPLIPLIVLTFIVSRFAMALWSKATEATRPVELTYAAFLRVLETAGPAAIEHLRISPKIITFFYYGKPAFTRPAIASNELMLTLRKAGVDFCAATQSGLSAVVPLLFPVVYLVGFWFIMRQAFGGSSKTKSAGKKGNQFRIDSRGLTFDDVAGIDAARGEVQELVDMLKQPWRYKAAGARLPRGVLMAGPPGTGKTLLARAMAAQAGVPFYYCSGSEFVEVFVGRGAARMRTLFKEAQADSPCIIFVDEVDAIGKQRSLSIAPGNSEAEQTLNQMLACMDGVDSAGTGVIVMAATNRYDVLDPALTRPGRFDRIIRITKPDMDGRLAILKVHTRKLYFDDTVNLRKVAEQTEDFSGAELEALANEAAIRSVRRSSKFIIQKDFEDAVATNKEASRRSNEPSSLFGVNQRV